MRFIWMGGVMSFQINMYTENTFKRFQYFGAIMKINETIQYIATDKNGDVYGFSSKPRCNNSFWEDGCSHKTMFLGVIRYTGDWQDSLMEVN